MKCASTLSLFLLASSPALAAEKKGELTVTWLGHAAFEVVSAGGTKVLIDPFLSQSPTSPEAYKKPDALKADAILVTHAHPDHLGDTVAIAKASGAKVVGVFEMVAGLGLPEAQVLGGNVGGTFQVGDLSVAIVPAMHSSDPGGRPIGFVVKTQDGRSLYHTGDTWIFGDMSLIQEIYKPEIILLNVGGGPFTEAPEVAAMAVKKYFKPKTIIPMHFGTFPPLANEDAVKATFGKDKRVVIMKPGETRKL